MLDAGVIAAARSFLFVPGDRPERFQKAARSGADAVILDLEDGVPAGHREQARAEIASWLDAGNSGLVRVNPVGTAAYREDIAALAANPRAVMVPKAERASDIESVVNDLPAGTIVVPIVETPMGVVGVTEMCASDRVVRVAFGNLDLAVDLGVDPASRDALAYARSKVVLDSAAMCRPAPIDGVSTQIEDVDHLVSEAQYAIAIGFMGKLCIHPRQVPHVNRAFTPDSSTVAWATRVVEQAKDSGAVQIDGEMVDAPVLRRARSILEAADLRVSDEVP